MTTDQELTETVIAGVIRGIADAEDVEPEDLSLSVQRHVSVSAIRQLVNHESESWRLRFEVPNHSVEVTGDGAIFVDGNLIQAVS